jgi:hypothetical protein
MEQRRGTVNRKEIEMEQRRGVMGEFELNEKGEEKRYSWYERNMKQLATEGGWLIGKK